MTTNDEMLRAQENAWKYLCSAPGRKLGFGRHFCTPGRMAMLLQAEEDYCLMLEAQLRAARKELKSKIKKGAKHGKKS